MTLYDDALAVLQPGLKDVIDKHLAADAAATDELNQKLQALQAEFDAYKASHPDDTPPNPEPTPTGNLRFGTYMGQFQAAKVKSIIGQLPAYSTYYYQVSGTTPRVLNVSAHKAEIDQGITQVIDLDYKQSTMTIAQVAAGNADTALTNWFKDLKTLTDYAKSKGNGAQVWFSFVHEAIVHINQNKFSGSGVTPTTAQMAAAWNRVMGLCRAQVPDAVRTYWFGGMEKTVNNVPGGVAHGDQLDPALIQAVTFDPYRFSSRPDTQPPQETFGKVVDALKTRSWFKNKPWGLTEWGTEQGHGDANNAKWITDTIAYLKSEGASIAVYFDRTDGKNVYNISTGAPLSLAAYKKAVTS